MKCHGIMPLGRSSFMKVANNKRFLLKIIETLCYKIECCNEAFIESPL